MIYCFVDNGGASNRLFWNTPNELAISGSSDMDSVDMFTARRISIEGNTIDSNLTFTADMSLDERVIECVDNRNPPTRDNCTLLVYSKYMYTC